MGSILVACLAGAPVSVAVEADAGVTVSVAEANEEYITWHKEHHFLAENVGNPKPARHATLILVMMPAR